MAAELSYISTQVLEERYYLRDSEGKVVEDSLDLWMRVASAIGAVEAGHSAQTYWTGVFYRRLSRLDFLANTPTLMNAGKKNGQLSACFVLPIEDSMEGIFSTLKNAALVHQTGGGTGFDFSGLRPEGSMVSNKSGVSTGPLAFCQIYDKATSVIKQGASRRGANMMTLRVDHPDIVQFIKMKSEPGVMTNFNVSVCVTNEFMDALLNGKNYQVQHPFTGPGAWVSAQDIWDEIAECAWASAEPGIIFIDRINEQSSFHETIDTVNPCGEQPLPPYGVCNLGSINVANFVLDGLGFDWEGLTQCVIDSVRFLDNVVDANSYPLPEIDRQAKRYRNIGLGIMGWADALIKIGIPYNSDEAVSLGMQLQSYINQVAHDYSSELALEKGVPEGVPFKSPFEWANPSRRNATLTTVAPTGTISMIAGCSSGIEPNFAFKMKRNQLDRTFTDYHPLWKQHLISGNTYKRETFIEADSVSCDYHVKMQAAFQHSVDSAISKTINLPTTATVDDIRHAYMLAWKTGCKGITVYRSGSRGEGVLSRIEESETCCDDPRVIEQEGCSTCYNCGASKCAVA